VQPPNTGDGEKYTTHHKEVQGFKDILRKTRIF